MILHPAYLQRANVFIEEGCFIGVADRIDLPQIEPEFKMKSSFGFEQVSSVASFKAFELNLNLNSCPADINTILLKAKLNHTCYKAKGMISIKQKNYTYELIACGYIKHLYHTNIRIMLDYLCLNLGGTNTFLFDPNELILMQDGIDLMSETRKALL